VLFRVIIAALLLLVTGCAGTSTNIPKVSSDEIASEKAQEQIFQIQKESSETARLQNVAYRIEVANRADCQNRIAPRLGFGAISLVDLPVDLRPVAAQALNLAGDQPTIIHVVDGGPAAKAGITPGDVLIAPNGEAPPSTKSKEWIDEKIKGNGLQPVSLAIAHAGQTRSASHLLRVFLGDSSPKALCSNDVVPGPRDVVCAHVVRFLFKIHRICLRSCIGAGLREGRVGVYSNQGKCNVHKCSAQCPGNLVLSMFFNVFHINVSKFMADH
jgi:hypothetical protein